MDEAIELAGRGGWVDIDTVEEDLARWFGYYLDHGGDAARLTVSSDASISSPHTMTAQLRSLVTQHGRPLEQVLPLATSNTARALGLEGEKGTVEAGKLADLLVMRRDSLDLVEVIARGRRLVREGELAFRESFLEGSNRRVHLVGSKS